METIEPPEAHYLSAAEGWLMLDNPREAARELDHLGPQWQEHPDVLQVRWQICAQQRQWEASLKIASTIVQIAPQRPSGWIHRSYTLHELRRTQEAYDNLFPVVRQFPKVSTIAYNLACYACQLGRLPEALRWFSKALKIGQAAQIRDMALRDADLKPLWPRISQLNLPS